MNNQPTNARTEDALTETYNDFRQEGRQQLSDASDNQKAYGAERLTAESDESDNRTADRWWLRKRLMGL